MTPSEFIAKWGPGGPSFHLNEEQGAQTYFLDLCAVLDVPTPGSTHREDRDDYIFEKQALRLGEARESRGYADVFYRDHFAFEAKAPGKNLDTALKQLLGYSLALSNPPLLVVCDRLTIRIHTQFNGHPSESHTVLLQQLGEHAHRAMLRRLWTDPESFRPKKTTRAITEAAARSFATLAELLRKRGHHADKVAHFLTQCVFSFFAEDVGLLPGRMFERMVGNRQITSDKLTDGLASLFRTMRDGGLYGADDIPWFNGGLFQTIDVPKLEILDITELRNAAALDWTAIDVSIFGTLFERGLDPGKRSQLGAHYTDPATIGRIVEPVIERPLRAEWAGVREAVAAQLAKRKKHGDKAHLAAKALFVRWLERLGAYRVLDPACGSGNFLFLALKALKDIENLSRSEVEKLGLDRETDLVTGPHNVLGIELNEYAAELARVTVWIGELQWRIEHGYGFKLNPVLEALDHIECRDALISRRVNPLEGQSEFEEAVWPKADAVVGNPPFLGVSRKRGELGETYTRALDSVFAGRVPGSADLVCYWFAAALEAIQSGRLNMAGMVATNSIRGGANRKVLDAIVHSATIFDAWSDEAWVNEGAAVRVSLIAFGNASGAIASLNGRTVPQIYPDLTAPAVFGESMNLSSAEKLEVNRNASFQGASKKAKFEIDATLARGWLREPNPNGRPNSDVLRPWANGFELSRRPQQQWIVDFGVEMAERDASLYEAPFCFVETTVKPERIKNNREAYRKYWWRFAEPRPGLRMALKRLPRFIATIAHAKHRFFVWLPITTSPDQALITIARADDTTFGILHSRIHELWSLHMCTWLGVGNDPRYTPTTCFETFPFPAGLTPADAAHQRTETLPDGAQIPADLTGPLRDVAARIAQAAHALDALRQRWLNPPEWTQRVPEVIPLGMDHSPYPDRIEPRPGISEADRKALDKRTLTNLYNQRPAWLTSAHRALDAAVAASYALDESDPDAAAFWRGYSADSVSETSDDAILARLLALNLKRAAAAGPAASKKSKFKEKVAETPAPIAQTAIK